MKRLILLLILFVNLQIVITHEDMKLFSYSTASAQHMTKEAGDNCQDPIDHLWYRFPFSDCEEVIVTPYGILIECPLCHKQFTDFDSFVSHNCPKNNMSGDENGQSGGSSNYSSGGSSGGGGNNQGESESGNNHGTNANTQINAEAYTPTEKEYLFALKHPMIAEEIGFAVHNSLNITTCAARFACAFDIPKKFSSYGDLKNDNVGTADARNAMRHTLWQAVIAAKYGCDIAKEIGNAHEENPTVDLNKKSFVGENAFYDADQTIDLLNNEIGREIGKNSLCKDMYNIMRLVLIEFYESGLYTAERKGESSYVIIREKISHSDYIKALNKLDALNRYGYTAEEWTYRMLEIVSNSPVF